MNSEFVVSFLGWCLVINLGILLYWSALLMWAPGWVYRMTSRFIVIEEKTLYTLHVGLLGFYKLQIIFFLLIPYGVLRILAG